MQTSVESTKTIAGAALIGPGILFCYDNLQSGRDSVEPRLQLCGEHCRDKNENAPTPVRVTGRSLNGRLGRHSRSNRCERY